MYFGKLGIRVFRTHKDRSHAFTALFGYRVLPFTFHRIQKTEMRRITNEQMRAHVAAQDASSLGAIKSKNETRARAPRTWKGYKRDFELLMDWLSS